MTKKPAAKSTDQPPEPPADPIADHPDGCPCKRCEHLEVCYVCERRKLDIDWCFNCKRLVL